MKPYTHTIYQVNQYVHCEPMTNNERQIKWKKITIKNQWQKCDLQWKKIQGQQSTQGQVKNQEKKSSDASEQTEQWKYTQICW